MKMNLGKTGILDVQGWAKAQKRWPALVEALQSLRLEEVEDQEDDLCRMLESVLWLIRRQDLKRAGWMQRRWDRHGPGVKGGAHDWYTDARWIDHPMRLTKTGAPTIYVSEPYNLSDEGILELAELVKKGWDIHISAWRAVHFPGHTLAIWMVRHPSG